MDARPPAFGVIRIARATREPWLVFRTELGADPDESVMHDVARFDDIGEARAVAAALQQYADAARPRGGAHG